MRLPSVSQILRGGLRTLVRFPLVLCAALVGTLSAVAIIDYEGPQQATILFNTLVGSIPGIPLLLGLALVAEKRSWDLRKSLGAQLAGVALLIGYAVTVPSSLSSAPAFHIQRLVLIAVAAHMFVSVAPYFGSGDDRGFWQFNTTLFIRVLGAAVYSHVLYAGLSLALAALDQLFEIDIPGKRYGELWVITFGILNTWLFLAGIPEDARRPAREAEYPKGLKVFVQYVLIPLAIIYLVIVTAYVVKITAVWTWSDGWVSKLILGLATTGLLSLLLVHPLREREDADWARIAWRWFFVVLVPFVVVMPLAVWRRIAEYGFTEGRYVALALAGWLMIIVTYFVLSRTKRIALIPASLGILSLAACVGPWGMFDVSERSQIERLKQLLIHQGILVDGTIRQAPAPARPEFAQQASSILGYLHEVHGFDGIQPWFRERLRSDSTGALLGWKEPAAVAKMLGIEYVSVRPGSGGGAVTFSMDAQASVDVGGYDRMMRFQYVDRGGETREIPEEGTEFALSADLDTLTIMHSGSGIRQRSVIIPLRPMAVHLLEEYGNESVGNVPPGKMAASGEKDGITAKVCIRSIQLRRRGERVEIGNVSLEVLYAMRATEESP